MSRLDAVTIFQSLDGEPVNKVVRRQPDGSLAKGMARNSGSFMAWHQPVPDLAALVEVLRAVGERSDQVISTSVFKSPPDRPFLVLSSAVLAQEIGCRPSDTVALSGFHAVNDQPAVARLGENMELGSYLLFDRDQADGMPAELAELNLEDWRAAVARLFPGFDACGVVWVPSTSRRVLVDGAPLGGPSGHAFVKVAPDPGWITHKWNQALLRALVTEHPPVPWEEPVGLAFPKPVRDRKGGTGAVLRHDWWTIVDRTTWAAARLVFDGAPIVEGDGLEVVSATVEHHAGPPLDLAAIKDVTASEIAAISQAIEEIRGSAPHITIERGHRGGKKMVTGLTIVVDDLTTETELQTRDGWRTVAALLSSGEPHVRCQTPFRESDSEAAFFALHADGTPYVYDSGTGEKHVLRQTSLREAWAVIHDWWRRTYDPRFVRRDLFYSGTMGEFMKPAQAAPTPDLMRSLAFAREAPKDKQGRVRVDQLPAVFNAWRSVAWGHIRLGLPREEDYAGDGGAGDELKGLLVNLLSSIVTIDWAEGVAQRASLAVWAWRFADADRGAWVSVRDYALWGRLSDDGKFELAMKPALASQVRGHLEVAATSQDVLLRRCRKYKLARSDDNRIFSSGKQVRAVVFTDEITAELNLMSARDDSPAARLHRMVGANPLNDKGNGGGGIH